MGRPKKIMSDFDEIIKVTETDDDFTLSWKNTTEREFDFNKIVYPYDEIELVGENASIKFYTKNEKGFTHKEMMKHILEFEYVNRKFYDQRCEDYIDNYHVFFEGLTLIREGPDKGKYFCSFGS